MFFSSYSSGILVFIHFCISSVSYIQKYVCGIAFMLMMIFIKIKNKYDIMSGSSMKFDVAVANFSIAIPITV